MHAIANITKKKGMLVLPSIQRYDTTMLHLGIETSCDETSAAIVEDGTVVRSCVISSSKKDFETIGGVVPEMAAREQVRCILPVIEKTLKDARVDGSILDAIAVTYGPGLMGSLLVGTTTARVLAALWKVPLIPVHHTLGHLFSTHLQEEQEAKRSPLRFPILTLSISGGHTDLWLRHSLLSQTLLGSTIDDAAGEAFDKGAVQLELPYPGGPALEKLASQGDPKNHVFPVALKKQHSFDCSFSGLKTALKYRIAELGGIQALDTRERADLAASYQEAIVAQLAQRVDYAQEKYPEICELHVVGGVSANARVRSVLASSALRYGVTFRTPASLRYCTDNGAMIAAAGHALHMSGCLASPMNFATAATTELSRETADCTKP